MAKAGKMPLERVAELEALLRVDADNPSILHGGYVDVVLPNGDPAKMKMTLRAGKRYLTIQYPRQLRIRGTNDFVDVLQTWSINTRTGEITVR